MHKHILEISRNFYTYRHLLVQMVVREVKGRVAGSSMGILWNFVQPLVMLGVFLFVFVYIFKLRLPEYGGSIGAAIYLMSGLFPWMALSEGFSRASGSLIENAPLIQKTVFPTEILPAKMVIAAFSTHGIAIVALAVYALYRNPTIEFIVFLPLILVLQVFFTLGASFIFACLSVFFRDTLQIITLFLNFWFYITPILYPVSLLPEWARTLMYLNPVYPFMSMYQSLFLTGTTGDYRMLSLACLWTVSFYSVGAFVFSKLKYEFADWL